MKNCNRLPRQAFTALNQSKIQWEQNSTLCLYGDAGFCSARPQRLVTAERNKLLKTNEWMNCMVASLLY